jgi:hypothetical protein
MAHERDRPVARADAAFEDVEIIAPIGEIDAVLVGRNPRIDRRGGLLRHGGCRKACAKNGRCQQADLACVRSQ